MDFKKQGRLCMTTSIRVKTLQQGKEIELNSTEIKSRRGFKDWESQWENTEGHQGKAGQCNQAILFAKFAVLGKDIPDYRLARFWEIVCISKKLRKD